MRRTQAEGGTSAFYWVADLGSRLVVMATTSRYFFRNFDPVPFDEGAMRRTKRGWDPSFFWQFVNGTHGTPGCLKRVVPLESVQRFRRVRPLVAGGILCRLFYCLRATEHGTVATTCSDGFPTPHRRTPGGR